MLLATLSIALLANDQPLPRTAIPQAIQTAKASVQILAAEEIRFGEKPPKDGNGQGPLRQYRTRDGMPMVEFY